MARFGTKHAGQAISRAHGKSNSLFPVKFCYILPACLTKKSVIYVQNSSPERSDYNDLARRLFTLKRFQYCRFQNTFQLAFSEVCCQPADHVCCLQVSANVANLALIEE